MRGTTAPEILFRDDFSSGTLDLASWTPNWLGSPGQITKPINGAEANCYDPFCVSVQAGAGPKRAPALVLSARAGDAQVDGTTYHYRSGCVTTHGKHAFTAPVRVEARILMPGDDAGEIDNWPGFWTDGPNWPQTGEIDIVEGLHGHAAFHVHDGPNPGGVGGNGALVDRPNAKPGTIGWHRFRSDWYPDHVDFAYDGQHVGSVSAGVSTFAGQQHYLILNYALSSSISPPIVVPSAMVVAWVQVSKL